MVSIALRGLGAIPREGGVVVSDNEMAGEDNLEARFDVTSLDAANVNGAPGPHLAVMPPQASGGLSAATAEAHGQRCLATRQPCGCEMDDVTHRVLQEFRLIADDFRQIRAEFRQMKADMGQMKAGLEQMKADVGQMQGTVADLPQVQHASRQMQEAQITRSASENTPTSLR